MGVSIGQQTLIVGDVGGLYGYALDMLVISPKCSILAENNTTKIC